MTFLWKSVHRLLMARSPYHMLVPMRTLLGWWWCFFNQETCLQLASKRGDELSGITSQTWRRRRLWLVLRRFPTRARREEAVSARASRHPQRPKRGETSVSSASGALGGLPASLPGPSQSLPFLKPILVSRRRSESA